jgi:hypothetical protein
MPDGVSPLAGPSSSQFAVVSAVHGIAAPALRFEISTRPLLAPIVASIAIS